MQRRKFLQTISLASAAAALPLAGQAESSKKKRSFTAAFISDIHVKPVQEAETGMRKALQNINQLKQRPDFIINGGDSIMDALAATKEYTQTQWSLFDKIMGEENKIPVKHCIGNHDIWGWQLKEDVKNDALYGKAWWLKRTGYQKPITALTIITGILLFWMAHRKTTAVILLYWIMNNLSGWKMT